MLIEALGKVISPTSKKWIMDLDRQKQVAKQTHNHSSLHCLFHLVNVFSLLQTCVYLAFFNFFQITIISFLWAAGVIMQIPLMWD